MPGSKMQLASHLMLPKDERNYWIRSVFTFTGPATIEALPGGIEAPRRGTISPRTGPTNPEKEAGLPRSI
jgi:hypothetical protein